jgi:nitrogen fixation protein FixH
MPVELNAQAVRKEGSGRGAQNPGFTLKGHHVLLMLLSFFGVIGLVNAYMITMALKTLPGIEVKSAFEQSQKFNKGLDALAEQNRKGWQVDVVSGSLTPGTPLSVQLRDKAGAPILGMRVTTDMQRPTDARLDHHLELRELGNGVYSAVIPELEPGQWRLAVEVKRGELREFFSEARVVAKD